MKPKNDRQERKEEEYRKRIFSIGIDNLNDE